MSYFRCSIYREGCSARSRMLQLLPDRKGHHRHWKSHRPRSRLCAKVGLLSHWQPIQARRLCARGRLSLHRLQLHRDSYKGQRGILQVKFGTRRSWNLLDRKLRIENCSVWTQTPTGSGISRVSANAKVARRVQERVAPETKFHEFIALPLLIVFWKINLSFSVRYRDHIGGCVGSTH